MKRVGSVKECPRCHSLKEIEEFGRNKRSADGLAVYCKACFRVISRESYRRKQGAAGKVVGLRAQFIAARGPRPDGQKWCPDCQAYLTLDEFTRNRTTRDGRAAYCKPHQNARTYRSRMEVHGGSRHYHLVRRYGVSAKQIEAVIEAQGGKCRICLRELGDKPHVDHDHKSGVVRGVLCFNCNGGLGQFADDPERLERAIQYVDPDLREALLPQESIDWPRHRYSGWTKAQLDEYLYQTPEERLIQLILNPAAAA